MLSCALPVWVLETGGALCCRAQHAVPHPSPPFPPPSPPVTLPHPFPVCPRRCAACCACAHCAAAPGCSHRWLPRWEVLLCASSARAAPLPPPPPRAKCAPCHSVCVIAAGGVDPMGRGCVWPILGLCLTAAAASPCVKEGHPWVLPDANESAGYNTVVSASAFGGGEPRYPPSSPVPLMVV